MPNGFDINLPFLEQPFRIYFYGIIITLGVIAAAFLSAHETRRRGMDPESVWDMLFWVVLAGIIGARLWHIFTPSISSGITTMYYLTHPLEILAIRSGGLGIPGAVIGGALAVLVYSRKHKMSFLTWADIISPGLALAQAIGRWGNYFNQELYGAPTDLPWKIYIDPAHRLKDYVNVEYYHPLFLYESLWNLCVMILLLVLGRKLAGWLKAGDLFLVYLMSYGLGRFLLEFLRLDIVKFGSINANQTFMAIVAVAAAGIFAWRHWPAGKGAPKA
jgi:phosphatidylglycerol:prolipoprotein diacylglycerol transferase